MFKQTQPCRVEKISGNKAAETLLAKGKKKKKLKGKIGKNKENWENKAELGGVWLGMVIFDTRCLAVVQYRADLFLVPLDSFHLRSDRAGSGLP